MAGPGKEYVLGKGRLLFDQFLLGTLTKTGERYLGNTPGFSIAQATEKLDHVDSDEGINVKDESVVLSNDMTGTMQTDNISVPNVALWFGGESNTAAVSGATLVESPIGEILLGRTYQLGVTELRPQGARKISTVVVTKLPATVIDEADNYTVDAQRGTITILPDAVDLVDGDEIETTHTQVAYSRTFTVGKANEIAGSLRFEATNPVGEKKDYYFPYVKLTPSGDYSLKGEEWQQMEFEIEVLKLNATTERVYIEVPPA